MYIGIRGCRVEGFCSGFFMWAGVVTRVRKDKHPQSGKPKYDCSSFP